MTGGVQRRLAAVEDLGFVAGLEARPAYHPFINRWTEVRHRAALADPDFRYLIFDLADGPCGYAILTGLTSPNAAIQLMRIALDRTGQGLGRACCELVLREAFDELGAHRLHLDLFEDNVRAERLYLSLGLRHEGLLRDAERRGDMFRSLKVMSILEPEYRARGPGAE